MAAIRKVIIPVAGLGTRFLPATKNLPKEMLPIVDKPALLFNIEEALRAGIHDIIIIQGRGKTAIEDFFDRSVELEEVLEKSGKTNLLERIVNIRNMANIISIRQKQALGLGHAILAGEPVVGKEPFAVLLGDEIMLGEPGVTHNLGQCLESTGISTVAVMEVPSADVSKYGIVELESTPNPISRVTHLIEKPEPSETKSRWALPGRYAFTPDIFEHIKSTAPGRNGEIQLTDAMLKLVQTKGLNATTFKDRRFDTGDKLGYLKANIELGLEHEEVGSELRIYLKELVKRL